MNKDQAIEQAARDVLAHGGPDCLTDPHIATTSMSRALDLGASHGDIAAEMKRQRGER